MENSTRPHFAPVGDNDARLFGMGARARACRLAASAGFPTGGDVDPQQGLLAASMDFTWDPAWLKAIAARPGSVLTLSGRPVMTHLPKGNSVEDAALVLSGERHDGLEIIAAEDTQLSYDELRKRERPFVLLLDPTNIEAAERAAYDASYKGVTDLLTLYLWRRAAFHLTRWAAEAKLSPNLVTAIGAVFCVLAFWLFWEGHYWLGVASGLIFMVLDTVDGKLARCTGASSKWGNVFDHGIDLIHPPFWWWAWAYGLAAYGTPLEPVYQTMLLWTIIGGYVAQRAIEGIFMRRYAMHIHVWQKIDSQFRLITARRNPNMVILVGALLLARPDVGLELIALWTLVSLLFHAVRLAQANARRERGQPIASWLT